MTWTEQQHAEMARRFESGGVLAVAAYVAELVATCGGTMTAEDLRTMERKSRQSMFDFSGVFEHITAQGATVATLQAKVAELERAGSDARAERDAAREDVTALRAEAERLKAELEIGAQIVRDHQARAEIAESRLAAIRERTSNKLEGGHRLRMAIVFKEPNRAWSAAKYEDRASEFARWVLEGDAPKDGRITAEVFGTMSENAPQEAMPFAPDYAHGDNIHGPVQSVAVARAALGMPEQVEKMSEAVQADASDPVGELALKAGAKRGREVASYRCGYEQACDDMRAACWEAVRRQLISDGWVEVDRAWNFIKAAIEGAAP